MVLRTPASKKKMGWLDFRCVLVVLKKYAFRYVYYIYTHTKSYNGVLKVRHFLILIDHSGGHRKNFETFFHTMRTRKFKNQVDRCGKNTWNARALSESWWAQPSQRCSYSTVANGCKWDLYMEQFFRRPTISQSMPRSEPSEQSLCGFTLNAYPMKR